jgi:hypothetical protein
MMTKDVHGFGIFGMWGPITDPGEHWFSNRVRDELGVNIHESPYRDYDVNNIVAEILRLPLTAVVLIWGTSLGANNAPIVAQYARRRIDGVFGFQASIWGAHGYVTSNVKHAHLISSDNPMNGGLGAYRWIDSTGKPGVVSYTTRNLPHPGDTDQWSQDLFLGEMKAIIANA